MGWERKKKRRKFLVDVFGGVRAEKNQEKCENKAIS
jgi:hypothetical protein